MQFPRPVINRIQANLQIDVITSLCRLILIMIIQFNRSSLWSICSTFNVILNPLTFYTRLNLNILSYHYFPHFQMLTQTKLVMTVIGKNGSADLVSLTSNGTDIANHLLSNGLVEYEKQRNRNKYGALVSSAQSFMLLWSRAIYLILIHPFYTVYHALDPKQTNLF